MPPPALKQGAPSWPAGRHRGQVFESTLARLLSRGFALNDNLFISLQLVAATQPRVGSLTHFSGVFPTLDRRSGWFPRQKHPPVFLDRSFRTGRDRGRRQPAQLDKSRPQKVKISVTLIETVVRDPRADVAFLAGLPPEFWGPRRRSGPEIPFPARRRRRIPVLSAMNADRRQGTDGRDRTGGVTRTVRGSPAPGERPDCAAGRMQQDGAVLLRNSDDRPGVRRRRSVCGRVPCECGG